MKTQVDFLKIIPEVFLIGNEFKLKKYTQLLNLWNIIVIAVYYLKEIAKKNEFIMNRNGGVTSFYY